MLQNNFLGEGNINSDEEATTAQDEGTDTDQHESLPEDKVCVTELVTAHSGLQKSVNTSKKAQAKDISTPLSPETLLKAKKANSKQSKKSIRYIQQLSSKSTSSGEKRKDSISVQPSDVIPVITISKTESSESILQDGKEQHNTKSDTEVTTVSHKPKIKYLLKKQNANVDIDSISFI